MTDSLFKDFDCLLCRVGSTTEDDFELTERNDSIPWWGSMSDKNTETFLMQKTWPTTSKACWSSSDMTMTVTTPAKDFSFWWQGWLSQKPEQTVSAGTHTFETSGPSWWWARASSYSGFFAPYASQLGNHFPLWTLNTVVCVKTRYLVPLWAFPETACKIEETQSYLHSQDVPLVRLISTFLLFREWHIS